MKTSNKILLFIGLGLLIVPMLNAFRLKKMIANGQYVSTFHDKIPVDSQLVDLPIQVIDSIYIEGRNNLLVAIEYGDTLSLQKGNNTSVNIKQEETTLTISSTRDDQEHRLLRHYVRLRTPSVKSISTRGVSVVETRNSTNIITGAKTVSSAEYYRPFQVNIQGFKTDRLKIHNLNGGGKYFIKGSTIKHAFITMGQLSDLLIDGSNQLDSLDIKTTNSATVTLAGLEIEYLKSDLDARSKLIQQGAE